MVKIVDSPKGIEGQGFFATSFDKVIGLARANSLWPLPFATSCCGIEFMATMGANYDLARFGSERLSFTPRQTDLLMVMGTISKKMGPVLKQVYDQMAEPKWVLSVGACACSGGIFDTYSVLQGIDKIIPVDVYVEAADDFGGAVRHYEVPDLVRVAAPIYLKFTVRNAPGLYPSGGHIQGLVESTSRERVRRASIGVGMLKRYGLA